ncbi:uncharacterized protein LOC121428097 [Lytechinus variegatus]|uniref:uncharacterized protein LOC121428097 n=1 Tax=Lytechinus variegatus TaxID=7654 RepID=UPI001BB0E828|nr:uncharacterized protein LOC121428097 [Lytechinus variegatus]
MVMFQFSAWIGCKYHSLTHSFKCVDGTWIDFNSHWWSNHNTYEPLRAVSLQHAICLYTFNGKLKDVICSEGSYATYCEAEPLPDTQQQKDRRMSNISKPATDRHSRALIGYCSNDHLVKLAPIGGKPRYAVVCKNKCY